MSRTAKPMERDLNQERHAQNGPPAPGSKTQRNDSQARFLSIAEVLEDVLTGIGASTDDAGGPVRITGNDPYVASPHRLATAATAAAGAHAVTTAALWRDRGGKGQSIDIDAHDALRTLHACDFQRHSGYRVNFDPFTQEPVTSIYRADRWVFFCGTYPHLRNAILEVLGTPNNRTAIANAVSKWRSEDLVEALAARGVPAHIALTQEEWRATEQGALLARRPLIELMRIGDADPVPLLHAPRPNGGMRVLDLTHVIAGPIAARSFAEHGADVLHISAPHLPDPNLLITDTGLGKRNAYLDLRQADALDTMRGLLRNSDVFVQSYRPGSLDRFGLSPAELAILRPGIISVSISMYGEVGPMGMLPGFDQIAQTATGIAITEGGDHPRLVPTYLFNDYVLGYLAAAGAQQALRLRAREGGSWLVRVSLTRVAMWLQDLGLLPKKSWHDLPGKDSVEGVPLTSLQSPFGQIERLPSPARFELTPSHYDLGPEPLGASPARWND
jgi:crotonobetainyl-CoA:carnitine CoA-transferase CaiB-like acyl-CoA transferase